MPTETIKPLRGGGANVQPGAETTSSCSENFVNWDPSRQHFHHTIAMRLGELLFTLLVATVSQAAADPFLGTWKLDAYQSNFTVGDPSFWFATMRIESAGGLLKSTTASADGEGFASNFTFSCALDGTPCPVVASTPMRGLSAVDTISLRRVNDYTITATGMKEGKLVYIDQRVVSADGNTMTVARAGTTPQGKKYKSTIVLVRSQ